MASDFMEGEYKKHHFKEHVCVFSKLTVEYVMFGDAS